MGSELDGEVGRGALAELFRRIVTEGRASVDIRFTFLMVVVVVVTRVVVEVVVEEVVVCEIFEPSETTVGVESCSWPVDGEFPITHGDPSALEGGGWVVVQEVPVQGVDVFVVVDCVDAPCAAGRETAVSKSQIAAAL